MKRTGINKVTQLIILAKCVFTLPGIPSDGSVSAVADDSSHFCAPFEYKQWRLDHPHPAAKRPAALNVGSPRTVRMIYFLPNDRPFRADVVDSMKVAIRQMQTLYTLQMTAHGYEDNTFRFETDTRGEPMIHRIDGQHVDRHYIEDTFDTVFEEVEQAFDVSVNIYIVVIDNSSDLIGSAGGRGGRWGKIGGIAMVPAGFALGTATHELGHAFGLKHDFRDSGNSAYIMGYGSQSRLSACNAEFLAVHPYFNVDVPIENAPGPIIELISPPSYQAESTIVSVQFNLSDSEGVHQVILLVTTREGPPNAPPGYLEVKACRGLAGQKNAVIEFEYDGNIPSSMFSRLSDTVVHPIDVYAVDTDGNVNRASFSITETSPYQVATLEGHMGSVSSVAFSPDGKTLASGSYDLTVKLWDLATSQNTATLEGHWQVSSVAFSPNGKTLASGSWDYTVKLWDIATSTNISTLEGHTDQVNSVSFAPDGKIIASGSNDRTVKLWDVTTKREIADLKHTENVGSVSFSPDGTILASAQGRAIKLWDVSQSTGIATIAHTDWITSVSFSPDGKTLASGSNDKTIRMWDVLTGQYIATLSGHADWISAVSFSPDGTTLASGSNDKTIRMWDVSTGRNILTLSGHTEVITSVSFSPDGTTIASGALDNKVTLWDVSVATRPRPRMLAIISGENQRGTTGAALRESLVVEVRDQYENPLPDALVTFTVTAGDGRLSNKYTVESATTDSDGRAERVLILGLNPGPNIVEVSVAGLEPVMFHAVGIGTSTTPSTGGEFKSWHLPDSAIIRLGKGNIGSSDRAVAFSPNGQRLALASSIGIWLFDVASARALSLLPTGSVVNSVSFAPDGTTLASGSEDDRTVRLWDVATGQNTATLSGAGPVRSVSFSPDGTLLASRSWNSEITLWDIATGQEIATIEGHSGPVNSVSFSPDGSTIASGSTNRTVELWDVETRQIAATLEGHTGGVKSVTFSPDGTILASGGDNTVKLWDVAARENMATLNGHSSFVTSVSFSPDGKVLTSGSWDGTVRLWDLTEGRNIATFGHTSWVESVSFSPNGTTLASGATGTVKLWDVETGNAVTLGYTNVANCLAFSPDGTTLASGAGDNTVKLWEVPTGRNFATLHTGWVNSLSFSRNGTILATGGNKAVKLWEVATGREINTLEHTPWVNFVAFSPDGTTLASGARDGTVKLWEVSTGLNTATLIHASDVNSVSFSPDGTTLASAGGWQVKTVNLWDVATGTNVATLEHTDVVSLVSYSPDGTTLASAGGRQDRINLWDVAAGENIATLEFDARSFRVNAVSFSPDGAKLASGSNNGTILLWDVATREKIAVLEGDGRGLNDHVTSVTFSHDGTILASGSSVGTILLWDMQLLKSQPQTLTKLSGDKQQGSVGAQLAEPFVISVIDQNGSAYTGAVVTFAVTAGKGTLSVATTTSDESGKASSTLTLGSQPGTNTVVVNVEGMEPVTFSAIGLSQSDFDGDGAVGFADFVQFAQQFGLSLGDVEYDARYDLDGNGRIGFGDFVRFAQEFGT